ncbi:hypothetical protein B0T21DRAFT_365104 [Apiosordaria backusii]|uniref:Uncharacterized protein n=1 Tax=Apiosordaria backusii TaxID=314023 RepID=A0AA40BNE4_9PEZI|nr:hypothetical protein B0T21DRAFT_365104 [Apiosordaria backusii]
MRTLQAMAASKEKFIPPTLKPNTNTSQDNPQAGKPTTTIHLPSQSTLQAEQARIDAETRSRLEERQERLNRAVQRENWANSMFFRSCLGVNEDVVSEDRDGRRWWVFFFGNPIKIKILSRTKFVYIDEL